MTDGQDPRDDPAAVLALIKGARLFGPDTIAPPDADAELREQCRRENEERAHRREQYAAREAAKKAANRHTLAEAAAMLGTVGGEREEVILGKLIEAARTGVLPTYEPGRNARAIYGTGEGHLSRVRDFYEEVFWDDLNRWIEAHESRVTYRFPCPVEAPQGAAPETDEHHNTLTAKNVHRALLIAKWGVAGADAYLAEMARQRAIDDAHVRRENRAAALAIVDNLPQQSSEHEGPSPVPEAVAPAPASDGGKLPVQTTPTAQRRRREDLLTPAIDAAKAGCVNPESASEVFARLQAMAREATPTPPLRGVTDGGVQWVDSNDTPKELSFDALQKRLRRANVS